MSLPTYKEATSRPSLPSLVAPYLDLSTLNSASRVDRTWSTSANRRLWADPFRSFSICSHPFLHAANFIKKCPEYRQGLRDLVRIIDVRPLLALQHVPRFRKEFAHHELAFGYVRLAQRCLLFNNLQFVILNGLTRGGTEEEIEHLARPTRILLFSTNRITSKLAPNLLQDAAFQDLIFLDLSYTCRVENFSISNHSLSNLRILKLRGLGLTRIPQFVLDLGTQMWSLDLRDNLLPDSSITYLLAKCFKQSFPTLNHHHISDDDLLYDAPPLYHPQNSDPSSDNFIPLRPDSMSSFIQYITDPGAYHEDQVSHVLPSTDPVFMHSGLTHLYISGNKISSPMIDILLRGQNRLQVLDVGSTRVSSLFANKAVYLTQYGCDSITPLLGCRLEKLRIHHSAVTRIPTVLSSESARGYTLEDLKLAEDLHGKISPRYLSPNTHHRLRSLTLTDIPTKSYGPIIAQLTRLLSECAAQESLLDAVKAGMSKSRRAPPVLSGLKTLRLEFLPQVSTQSVSSVSGDRDADGFLEQIQGDFSFFGGSSGATQVEKGTAKIDVKDEREDAQEEPKDVVEALKTFRKAQKPAGWNGTLELVWPRGR